MQIQTNQLLILNPDLSVARKLATDLGMETEVLFLPRDAGLGNRTIYWIATFLNPRECNAFEELFVKSFN